MEIPSAPSSTLRRLVIRGAAEHNLKHVDLEIPTGQLVVVTGVSGSGKSSLAFDTIGIEGRRRYLETFSSYTRQFFGRLHRPAVERIDGLPPAVVLDQSSAAFSPRSTVGTLTELYDLLRLVWARWGEPDGSAGPVTLRRHLFSFNSPHGACPACQGLGTEDRIDPDRLVADPTRTIREGALRISTPNGYLMYSQVTLDVLNQVCAAHGFSVDIPWANLSETQRNVVLNGSDRIRIPYGKHPLASRMKWTGITVRPRAEGVYRGILPVMDQILRQGRNDSILRFVASRRCTACEGTRLNPAALSVRYQGLRISDAAALPIREIAQVFAPMLPAAAGAIRDLAVRRCAVLDDLGLTHLTLDRDAASLSGGELQRLRLARQATIGLSGLLYVLDEPSVGLHACDTARLLAVLRRLRDQGNTVLVVEHDEQIIAAADWVIDVGPGAGASGGEILYNGPAHTFLELARRPVQPAGIDRSPTAAHLARHDISPVASNPRPDGGWCSVRGISAHNLHGVDIRFRLAALNLITGVSGAGKSTLVRAVCDALGPVSASSRTTDTFARCPDYTSDRPIDRVVHVDHTPIGRTPRSNPATYTGIFDVIRERFAAEPKARRLGLAKSHFSFNVRGGRCETCEGAGVVTVGMQFLGTVATTCEACGGRRFGDDTLGVTYRGLSIADVLGLSINEACAVFADVSSVSRTLVMLRDLGLGYLALGHPATALSGGEAQRVKLATWLTRPVSGHTLFVLDEPTTGLHAADVRRLLRALTGLVDRGDTVMTVEHHLDVIAAADWIVDLGPGCGADGGRIVVTGAPEDVVRCEQSLTGLALRERAQAATVCAVPPQAVVQRATSFVGVTTHNLKHIDVTFPAGALTVVTGVSGSGKSSLVFDTLFAEGQRRYTESLSAYSRRLVRLPGEAVFESVSGLTATVAVRQQVPSRNPRSTVASMTECHETFRLLFSRAGHQYCPTCQVRLVGIQCPSCNFTGRRTLTASLFSPNTEVGACQTCGGLGVRMDVDTERLITHPARPIDDGAMAGHKIGRHFGDPHGQHVATLRAAASAAGIDISRPWQFLPPVARALILDGSGSEQHAVSWSFKRGSRTGVHQFSAVWVGLRSLVRDEYLRLHDRSGTTSLDGLMEAVPCPSCRGGRLGPESAAVRYGERSLPDWLALTIDACASALREARQACPVRVAPSVIDRLTDDLLGRLFRLSQAGVGYLSLDRTASSLSAGESQRVRLAAQVRSGLSGVTYILDEPTAGLHPRDTRRLIELMEGLRDEGNAVVVVEHDLDVVRAADHVIELGPGAGPDGGRCIAVGPPDTLRSITGSATGRLLAHRRHLWPVTRRRLGRGLTVRGAHAHNLARIDVTVPSGALVAVTGVSGSGKSSLVFDVLAPSLARRAAANGSDWTPVGCDGIDVHDEPGLIVAVAAAASALLSAQRLVVTTGLLAGVCDRFAASAEAVAKKLKKTAFVPEAPAGRCPACEGRGDTVVALDFLPDVCLPCEECGGSGFAPDILDCRVSGLSISDVLTLSVRDALMFYQAAGLSPRAWQHAQHMLDALQRVGLGHLPLGRKITTLSGGERQRLVLAMGLAEAGSQPVTYLLDEPTTGLHMDDVVRVLGVMKDLVEKGHSVVVVEHHLDVIAASDWVIDLGPEGGPAGGQVVAEGPPSVIAACERSWTGQYMRRGLR